MEKKQNFNLMLIIIRKIICLVIIAKINKHCKNKITIMHKFYHYFRLVLKINLN